MPEAADQPERPKRERNLVGFYVAMGVVAALVGLGTWLWTPIKVLYFEREARKFDGTIEYLSPRWGQPSGWSIFFGPAAEYAHFNTGIDDRAELATDKLASMGPVAHPAFARLLRDTHPQVRGLAIVTLGTYKITWAPDLIVEASKDQDDKVAAAAVWAMENISGLNLTWSGVSRRPTETEIEHSRQTFLDWWWREGKTKNGGGGK